MSQQLTCADILNRLKSVKPKPQTYRSFNARCPAHEQQRGGLTISTTEDERVVMRCRAGCSDIAICFALGIERNKEGGLYERHS